MIPELIFLVICAAAIVYATRAIYLGYKSGSWPSVQGEILSSELHTSWSRLGPRYEPQVFYRYTVDRQTFNGYRLAFGIHDYSIFGEAIAAGIVRDHPTGSLTLIHYDPAQPRRSILLPGIRIHPILELLFWGGLAGLIGHDLWRSLTSP